LEEVELLLSEASFATFAPRSGPEGKVEIENPKTVRGNGSDAVKRE